MVTTRNHKIDVVKGVLIILVIIGHSIASNPFEELNRNNNLALALIYSFHIPVFIGVSGYLFNIDKVAQINLFELFKKYRFRIIVPWLIAALVYYMFSDKATFSMLYPVKAVFNPYYHLWFIPAFLFWVGLTWSFKKLKVSDAGLLSIGFIITVLVIPLKKFAYIYNGIAYVEEIMFYFINVLKPYYFFYFTFGVFLKRKGLKNWGQYLHIPILILFLGVIYFYYYPILLLSSLNLFLLNAVIMLWLFYDIKNLSGYKNKLLQWIGKNSLGFYLWHVMPIIIAKRLTFEEDIKFYALTVILLEIVFYFIYRLLFKIDFFKRYVFGM